MYDCVLADTDAWAPHPPRLLGAKTSRFCGAGVGDVVGWAGRLCGSIGPSMYACTGLSGAKPGETSRSVLVANVSRTGSSDARESIVDRTFPTVLL